MDNHRQLRPITARDGCRIWIGGREYIDFSSNDYLGLSRALADSESELPQGLPSGATGSRLLAGDYQWTHDLETELAADFGYDRALIFNSGYQLSVGLLPTLVGPSDIVFADRHIHASWIDGCCLSGARLVRFAHNDTVHLKQRLQALRATGKTALIVVESLYSMDGDSPDFMTLLDLKAQFDCRLIVDEAHAIGVMGSQGLGMLGGTPLAASVDFITATFGKALASFGAFVCCAEADYQTLIQNCRSFIFSTALPPSLIFQNHRAYRRMKAADLERVQLARLAHSLRAALATTAYAVMPGTAPIIPVVIGETEATVAIAAALREQGLWCLPITHPTVPQQQARLRLSITAAHSEANCHTLVAALSQLS